MSDSRISFGVEDRRAQSRGTLSASRSRTDLSPEASRVIRRRNPDGQCCGGSTRPSGGRGLHDGPHIELDTRLPSSDPQCGSKRSSVSDRGTRLPVAPCRDAPDQTDLA